MRKVGSGVARQLVEIIKDILMGNRKQNKNREEGVNSLAMSPPVRLPVWVSCWPWLGTWLQTSHSCCLVAVTGQKGWSLSGWTLGLEYTYKARWMGLESS